MMVLFGGGVVCLYMGLKVLGLIFRWLGSFWFALDWVLGCWKSM